MIDCGNWVLPRQRLLGNQRTEIPYDRSHVAVRQLEPGAGKRVRELIGMLVEASRDLFVSGIEAQGEIRSQHGWTAMLFGIERIGDRTVPRAILWSPLVSAGGALRQLPFVVEKVLEEVVAPLC